MQRLHQSGNCIEYLDHYPAACCVTDVDVYLVQAHLIIRSSTEISFFNDRSPGMWVELVRTSFDEAAKPGDVCESCFVITEDLQAGQT
jgi:hypothetical protein